MMTRIYNYATRVLAVMAILVTFSLSVWAEDKVYPDKPNPARLVNDYAHLLSDAQQAQLEQKLEDYANNTSTQITIVTMSNLGGHDVSEYSVHVFNDWGLGQEGKNNGVLMLVALDDGYGKRKAWITVGKGLQGVLTDAKSGQIFRNEMVPAFKEKDYFKGLSDASDAIIAVTKGEYTNENKGERSEERSGRSRGHAPFLLVFIIFIIIIIITRRRGGGGGGGGIGDIATGMILGNMLGRGSRGWGGGSDWGGGGSGGFGGFGGGSTDGGGAGGSW